MRECAQVWVQSGYPFIWLPSEAMRYRREDGEVSERTLWPLGLVFWGHCWTLGAWCELRQGFRTFRVDRIEAVELGEERFDDRYGHLWGRYLAEARGDC